MMKITLKTLTLLGLAICPLANATPTDPVGVVKLTIAAAAAADQPTYSYLSTSMSAEMAYQGTVSAGGTGTITIGSDDWTVDQFNSVPYYVIVASGTREGEMLDIASNTVNTLTLNGGPATESQIGLIGATIRIHKHNTIASIFGADPAVGTVQKGSKETADHILLHDGIYKTYYYNTVANTGGLIPTALHLGWVDALAPTQDAGNTVIYPDDGFLYKRVNTSSFDVKVIGTVITNVIKVPIVAGTNMVAIPYPVDKSVTFSESGLAAHLQAGSKETADLLIIHNGTIYETYYINDIPNTGGLIPTSLHLGWVNALTPAQDAGNSIIPAAKAIFVIKKENTPFYWTFQDITQ